MTAASGQMVVLASFGAASPCSITRVSQKRCGGRTWHVGSGEEHNYPSRPLRKYFDYSSAALGESILPENIFYQPKKNS